MKKANGIVLDKPGKPDYRTPASFRNIILLKTVSKILERLSALRLASTTRSLGLLHPNQCGSLAGLGCFDAVTTLTHEVRLLQAASFKESTLFLDVKGGFDNLCPNKLANTLTKGRVSAYLVAWIKSFPLNANADSFSKARLRFSARLRLAPLKARRFLLFFLCFT